MINDYYSKLGMPGMTYDLYSNYGNRSLGEKNATFIRNELTRDHFTKDTWFSLSRFMIYRSTIPDFIYNIEPFFRIQFRGMTAAYIYRGDQLVDYMEFFRIEQTESFEDPNQQWNIICM